MTTLRESLTRIGGKSCWVPSALQTADALTKINDCNFLRFLMEGGLYQIQSEVEALRVRAEMKTERLARGAQRAEQSESRSGTSSSSSEESNEEAE